MELFHVLNRGVDRRTIVIDQSDRLRFMQGLYIYNDANILGRNARRKPQKQRVIVDRDPLVHIHAFCLMDNHYHLLLSPVADDMANLSAFMQKLNMGYAKYFNEKYERTGALWQGKYKSIHLTQDAHFMYIPYYLHLNPLDVQFPEWRAGGVQNVADALAFLQTYKWSSFKTYQSQPHYRSITDTTLIAGILGTPNQQEIKIKQIITTPALAANASSLE